MIDKLYMPGTEDEPEINFDAANNLFEISGRSIPENANTIFFPILEWLNRYFVDPNKQTNLVLKLEYLNSASSKKMIEVLALLEENYLKGFNIIVHWLYENGDTSMKNKGREMLSIFKIPFEISTY
jgi:hypothetical protein